MCLHMLGMQIRSKLTIQFWSWISLKMIMEIKKLFIHMPFSSQSLLLKSSKLVTIIILLLVHTYLDLLIVYIISFFTIAYHLDLILLPKFLLKNKMMRNEILNKICSSVNV